MAAVRTSEMVKTLAPVIMLRNLSLNCIIIYLNLLIASSYKIKYLKKRRYYNFFPKYLVTVETNACQILSHISGSVTNECDVLVE
jgi:hypothetical protein